MRLRALLPLVLSLAVFAVIPASTAPQAMSLVGGIAKTDDGLITGVAKHSCRHIKNRHQRQLCLHPKKPKRRAGREN